MNQKIEKNIDRVFRLPRVWSNWELKKFAHLFEGNVANISGWKDFDKENSYYKAYFTNAKSYTITNFKSEARGFQGSENEIFLDLTVELPVELKGRFDVVFNHTVLEHIYDVKTAFKNLCILTTDIAIVVVPFLQEMHGDYGDYWRFTPSAMKNMFEENGMSMLYCSFNSQPNASVYIFCIASKNKEKWNGIISNQFSTFEPTLLKKGLKKWVGYNAIQNEKYSLSKRVSFLSRILKKLSFNVFKS